MEGMSEEEAKERTLNFVDMIPKNIEVKMADIWK
jgi:hypothetical protein